MCSSDLVVGKTKQRERAIERAEFLWARAQKQAAIMSLTLEDAVDVYEEHKDSVDPDAQIKIDEQISAQRKQIEDFIMNAKDTYLQQLKEADE